MKLKTKIFISILGGGMLLGLSAETFLWRNGYGDFPLFDVDAEIGYIPKPNTAGTFAGRFPWAFNSQSMRNEPFVADPVHGVLLLSDSIVYGGGIDLLPAERLGACLQAQRPDCRVWAIGAGSWAFFNELTYLKRHPEVVDGVHRILWIVNSEDFTERTQWRSEQTHPRTRPWCLSLYLAHKYLGRRFPALLGPAVSSTTGGKWNPKADNAFDEISKPLAAKITLCWYPEKNELPPGAPPPEVIAGLRAACQRLGVPLVLLPAGGEWSVACYRDSIHPNPAGNRALAAILAAHL